MASSPGQTAVTPMVSVIIVSWNARKYLEQCLTTLTEEVCRYPMEIIVVDNKSSDGSIECVQQQFPQVRLICNDANVGFAKANNLGIAQSRGKYLCLVNSDVKVLSGCITKLVEYAEARPKVGVVGPYVIGGDGLLQRSCRGFPNLWNMFWRALAFDTLLPKARIFSGYMLWHWPQIEEAEVEVLSGCFWLIKREAYAEVGGLDENFFMYAEDIDWCLRFHRAGWKLMFMPEAKAIHYGGASAANAPLRFYLEMQRADLQYWNKNHSGLAVGCYFLIACLHQIVRVLGFGLFSLITKQRKTECLHKVELGWKCLKWLFDRKPIPGSNAVRSPASAPVPASSQII